MAFAFGFTTFLLDVFLLTAIVKRGFFKARKGRKALLALLAAKAFFLFLALAFGLGYFQLDAVGLVLGAFLGLVCSAIGVYLQGQRRGSLKREVE